MTAYLELHGCEFIIIGALFIGVVLGGICGFSLGKDQGYYCKRDAKGKFVKRNAPTSMRRQPWEPDEVK